MWKLTEADKKASEWWTTSSIRDHQKLFRDLMDRISVSLLDFLLPTSDEKTTADRQFITSRWHAVVIQVNVYDEAELFCCCCLTCDKSFCLRCGSFLSLRLFSRLKAICAICQTKDLWRQHSTKVSCSLHLLSLFLAPLDKKVSLRT